MEWLIQAMVFTAGLVFGSFATLASYRLPRGEDIIFKPSRCPNCNHELHFFDLFPVFSWLFQRAKCRYCRKRIKARYPLIELSLATTFLVLYLVKGLTPEFFILALLAVCLLILIITDLENTIIPDKIQGMMVLLGVAYQLLPGGNVYQLFLGPLIGVGSGVAMRKIFWLWKRQEALGLGDVKFLAVVGIFLPPDLIITFLFLSGMIGITTALLWHAKGKGKQFPFGPALAVSLLFCLVIPEAQRTGMKYLVEILL